MVSIKDIAQKCNVSIATVSKALNGHHDVSEETRARVREAAQEMGYITNAAARSLKTNRTYNIGIIFEDNRSLGLAHDYFSLVLGSVRNEAEDKGYDITFISRNADKKYSGYLQHCQYRSVDGVIIVNEDYEDPMVVELVHSELPLVTIDHVFNNRIAVMSDNFEGPRALVRYAAGMGHKRIAFLHGESTSVSENRVRGFYSACEESGIKARPEYLIESRYHDAQQCYENTKRLLSLEEPPTCIIFPDDYSSIGGINAIREAGLSVPEDVSVMGYDGIGYAEVMNPSLTTYRQNTEALGRTAAAKLIELIEKPRTAVLDRIIISGSIVKGGSVVPPGSGE
ncbi:MAG: LacI family DNA-binding transcriptional regulator [Lachnospiraceae bacterium]|nr:LacI family DNA-binding transcriptional regulator [Lachnospiraceae bacterium]